ncbi:MAG: hypothetical protein KAJ17_10090, partial [Candidatus Krumholzibacteria bacterium]|nr:hypothetical protein [Candidatus Krumholzibacteria bacterium]
MRYPTIGALLLALTAALLMIAGCERSTEGLQPDPGDTNPVVFSDEFDGIDFHAFLETKLDALDIDTNEGYHRSEASIKITVPPAGDPSGGYAGGAITANFARNLSQYNALAFWAKASIDASLDIAGYGNDNTGSSKYMGAIADIALTTYWQRYILPIPRTGVLVPERGLFQFAEGPENGKGYVIWFDEIEFVNVDAISNPRPIMRQDDVSAITGVSLTVEETSTAFDVTVPNSGTIGVAHSPGYFTFYSSNEDVAVPDGGVIRIVGGGTADITAKLDTIVVAGRFTISALDPPSDAAPVPTIPASDVISIFSNAYTNRPVDTFSPEWDNASVSDFKIAGDDVKVYNIPMPTDVAVIEFATQTINATSMTHVHIDICAPEGTFFGLGLVDFGPDDIYNPPPDQSDDSEQVVAFVPPELVFGQWLSLDIPMSDFT